MNEKGSEEWDKFVRIEERSGLHDEDDGEHISTSTLELII